MLDKTLIKKIIRESLAEDVGAGDYSSLACIPSTAQGNAILKVKDQGILAGVEMARYILEEVNPKLALNIFMSDGEPMKYGDIAFEVIGDKQSILKAERLVLNFMQRMSGIASLTDEYVKKIKHTSCKILDTRKTTPLMRYFEKWAVRIGGGVNHRFGLYDMIMLKDNHIDFAGGIENAILSANAYIEENQLPIAIEIETRSLAEIERVLAIGKVQRIMIDNFTPELCAAAVRLIDHRFETEASGGINLDTVVSYAETGVDYVSVGALTHQFKSKDMSLKVSRG